MIWKKYGLNETQELKWNLIKSNSVDLYIDIIKYFFNGENDIKYRAILINKSKIDNKIFNKTDDDFYHKMYYQTLEYIMKAGDIYNIYPDIKDTNSYHRHQKVLEYLRIKKNDLNNKTIKKVQPIRSNDSSLLQLTDILIGAQVYYNNFPTNTNKNKELVLNEIINNTKIKDTTEFLLIQMPDWEKRKKTTW